MRALAMEPVRRAPGRLPRRRWWAVLALALPIAGCVTQSMYAAKVEELERVRAEAHEHDVRNQERMDRLSMRLNDLEKQSGQTALQLGAALQLLGQVKDTLTQVSGQVTSLSVASRTATAVPVGDPWAGKARPEPGAKNAPDLRDPFHSATPAKPAARPASPSRGKDLLTPVF